MVALLSPLRVGGGGVVTVFPFAVQYFANKVAAGCCHDLTFREQFFEQQEGQYDNFLSNKYSIDI